jgi:hypothetical protein
MQKKLYKNRLTKADNKLNNHKFAMYEWINLLFLWGPDSSKTVIYTGQFQITVFEKCKCSS